MKGSFRKRGSKWSFSIDLGVDPATGKRKQTTKTGFHTKKEAQAYCADLIVKFEQGNYSEPSKMLLDDYLEKWLVSKQQSIEKSTHNKYATLIRVHIKPLLGKIALSKLEPFHITEFYNLLATEKCLSPTTIQDVHAVIKNALNQAIKWQLINRNVASLVSKPKGKRKKIEVWSEIEANSFLHAAQNSQYYVAFLLALTTGMRQGEILGLAIEDINLNHGTLSVTQTLSHSGKDIRPYTKTSSGHRLISIDPTTLIDIKKQSQKVKKTMLASGGSFNPLGLLLPSQTGTPTTPRNLMRAFQNLKEKAAVKSITFHELRHTHATILLKNGANPKAVAERLGHSDASVLLNIYAHILPNMQKDLADQFGKMFYKSQEASIKNSAEEQAEKK
ncbi:site-specific integrase [Alkalihalobacillus oceani]|uniref:site-specific integrase n=1 Tax=Halalkalibacter oceani TaxID=1653776 RepID=UPI002040627D|nr:site-specific integrase [Halalkalibacter oceani]MCM3761833.1 site-specific integrase [Halalkalibacter oceani]